MMKSEPRPFASLSSGLLARKGAARPAMRPQGFNQIGNGLDDLGWNDMGGEAPRAVAQPVEHEPVPLRPNPATGLSPAGPVPSPVHAAQHELIERLGQEVEEAPEPEMADMAEPVPVANAPFVAAPVVRAAPTPRVPRAANSGKAKTAFTLRLDAERHLKLRLACAVGAVSAQQLVTRALDQLLDAMPELDAIAAKAPERLPRKG